jgi:hypothetical protein
MAAVASSASHAYHNDTAWHLASNLQCIPVDLERHILKAIHPILYRIITYYVPLDTYPSAYPHDSAAVASVRGRSHMDQLSAILDTIKALAHHSRTISPAEDCRQPSCSSLTFSILSQPYDIAAHIRNGLDGPDE